MKLCSYGAKRSDDEQRDVTNPDPKTSEWREPQKGSGKPQVLFALGAARETPPEGKKPMPHHVTGPLGFGPGAR